MLSKTKHRALELRKKLGEILHFVQNDSITEILYYDGQTSILIYLKVCRTSRVRQPSPPALREPSRGLRRRSSR